MSVNYNARTVTDGLVSLFDAANPKSFSPNVFSKPTDIYSWINSATGNACTLNRDTIPSPIGNTPLKMAITGNDPYTSTYNSSTWNICPTVSGDTWTISVWLKASVATTCELWLIEANSSGGYLQGVPGAYSNPSLTTQWQRFTVSGTVGNASTAYLQWRFDGTPTSGSGINIWIDGIQIERGLTMTTFNPKANTNRTYWWDIISGYNLTNYGNPPYNAAGYFTFANDQTTQYMMNSSYPMPTDDHTIDCWFYYAPSVAQSVTPYTYSVAGDNQYLLFIPNATTITPYSFNDASYSYTPSDLRGSWHNFVRTRTKTSGVEMYYLDGKYVGTRTQSANTSATTNGYLIIGQEADTPGGGFDAAQNLDGSFSKLAVYNRALSAAEVNQNFNAMRGRYGV